VRQPRSKSTGIVLAGGRSTRFGSDKLRATIDGRTVLEWAVTRVASVCEEVVVAFPHDRAGWDSLPPGAIAVPDREPEGGPLVGLLTAADAARHDRLLIVGGDMPSLVPRVLRRLLEALGGHEAAALGLGSEDRAQPLPLALARAAVIALDVEAAPASEPRSRSLHSVIGRLHTVVIPEATWRPLDPAAATLRDVDTPDDLLEDRD
jgi:molybdenum cofactor guanylyltransferase